MRLSLALTVLSAVLYGASFPPWSFAPLAWVALVPLLVAVMRVSPVRAAACGVVWGVVAAYVVGWWFPGMVSSYFHRPPWVGWATFFAVSVGLAGSYYGVFAAWVSWLARHGVAGPLAITAGWGACELARARLWVGNPWALSAYSQSHAAHLMQLADVAGPYGIGMLIAAVNAVMACAVLRTLRGVRLVGAVLVVASALGATLSYGLWRLGQDFSAGGPIKVAIVQGALDPSLAGRADRHRVALDRYLALTEQAGRSEPDLIVWPEYAVSFYLQERTPERERLLASLRVPGPELVLGGPSYRFAAAGTQYHNSVFLVRDAMIVGRYDKVQLLPWAEQTALGQRVDPLAVFYTPGAGQEPLRTRVAGVGAFLCFEAMYPELLRSTGVGADLLANLSNDAWFGAIPPARHHLEIAAMRAIEARRYLLRATSTGFSAIIDPHGRIRQVSGFGEPAVLTDVVYPSAAESPYRGWGGLTPWLSVAGVVVLTLVQLGRLLRPPALER